MIPGLCQQSAPVNPTGFLFSPPQGLPSKTALRRVRKLSSTPKADKTAQESGGLEYGENIYSAGTLSCRELPVTHYPDATDSDSDQERLQEAFERYGTTRQIPFS